MSDERELLRLFHGDAVTGDAVMHQHVIAVPRPPLWRRLLASWRWRRFVQRQR